MNPNNPTIILASSSETRKSLLNRLSIPYQAISPDIDETAADKETPKQLVLRLAQQKAQAISRLYDTKQPALIIGSDQVAVVDEHILGKPGNPNNAIAQLTMCSGKTVYFYTSIALLNTATGSLTTHVDQTEVVFRTLQPNEIESYVNTEKPFMCAGSFKCEGLGISLFKKINNQDPTALMGLPLIQLCTMLREQGIDMYTPR